MVQKKFEKFYYSVFSLNMHEMECFETQKKYSQLLFEDFVMFLLNLLIFAEVLNIPLFKKSEDGGENEQIVGST